MSQPKSEPLVESAREKLIIDDHPYQFLPGLAHLLGDAEALILQQLHWILRSPHPHFWGEPLDTAVWQGRLWVRIELWMWWDDIEGFCLHLAERTFNRKKARLEDVFGVLLTTDKLNVNRDDKVLWWTINYEGLNDLSGEYLETRTSRIAERKAQRRLLKELRPGTKWRPNIRLPESDDTISDPNAQLARASCQNGKTVSPLIPRAEVASCQNGNRLLPERQLQDCQVGNMEDAKLAMSANYQDNVQDNIQNQQQHHAIETQTIAVVDVESIDSRSGDLSVRQLPNSHQNPPKPTNFSARPDVANAVNDELAEQLPLPASAIEAPAAPVGPREMLQKRLATYAAAAGYPLTDDVAARLVAAWPDAELNIGALIERLTIGYEAIALNKPISPNKAAQMVRDGENDLRWLLFTWQGHDESRDDYYEPENRRRWDKTSIFITAHGDKRNPPLSWLHRQIAEMSRQEARAKAEAAEAEAQQFLMQLSAAQLKALERDVLIELRQRFSGQFFNHNSPEFHAVRAEMLTDPKTREWLLLIDSEKAPQRAVNGAVGALADAMAMNGTNIECEADEADEIEAIETPQMPARYGRVVAGLTQRMLDNVMSADALDELRESIGDGFDDAEWEMVLEEARLRARPAA